MRHLHSFKKDGIEVILVKSKEKGDYLLENCRI
jgi:hypothetical protein